jgi:hypothetical protein
VFTKRKKYTKRQIVQHWDVSDGRCWRCGEKIAGKPTPVYGTDWVLGHVGKAHWAGGVKVAPEHTACNAVDGREQTKLAAKSIRIRARDIGVKTTRKPWKPDGAVYCWKRRRYVYAQPTDGNQ